MTSIASEETWDLLLPDEGATRRLAMDLARALRSGDLVTLAGNLGTGKSTLARAILREIADDAELEVPSPTFTLMQVYELKPFTVVHADLYRVRSADELDEIGWDSAADDAAVLVEWPDRAEQALAADRLDVLFVLAPEEGETARRIRLIGRGSWAARLARMREIRIFLDDSGWGIARRRPLAGDASSRRYERLVSRDRHAVLMDAPAQPDGPPVRDGLPYSRIAHLAENVTPYVAVARALRARGLSAPDVLAADLARGLLVVEDLGDVGIVEGDPPVPILARYQTAAELLAALHATAVPPNLPVATDVEYALPRYDIDALLIEVELLIDWYLPHRDVRLGANDRRDFLDLWRKALQPILQEWPTWVLRDFHSPNLLWLEGRAGIARVGLIDFQDALLGPAVYDVVSLAQDARVDVGKEDELSVVSRYVTARHTQGAPFDVAAFARAYATLGAQRSSKILGIFARLNRRDGKPQYLAHLPRIGRYLKRGLAHPLLSDLAAWYEANVPLPE